VSIFSVEAQNSFDLEGAIKYGIENNASKKLDALELAKANAEIREYISIGLPKISGSVNLQHFVDIPTSILPGEFTGQPPGSYSTIKFGLRNNFNAGVDLNTLIFDGSFFVGLRAQKLYRELVKKQANMTDYQISKNITQAYLTVLIAQKNRDQLLKNVRLLAENLEETKLFYDNGFIEKLDVDRLSLSVDNLNAEVEKIERTVRLLENLLKFQMSYPLEQDIELIESLDDRVDRILVEGYNPETKIDYDNRPEYETILLGEELNNINIKSMQSGYLPSLRGFASYQSVLQRNDLFDENGPGFFPTTIVGLSLNVPIWDGNTRHSQIQQAKVDRDKTLIDKMEFERAVTLEVLNSRIQFENARSSVNNAKRSESLANSIYEVAQIKFKEGVGSSLELSQAESELFQAQSNYINALYDLVEAKSNLEFALGNY
jgi:outer membrane protein TolC